MNNFKKNILVLAAHPDDEMLGCGGALQYYKSIGYTTFTCIVTDGSSSQYPDNQKLLKQKKQECSRANKFLGVEEIFFLDFPDMQLATIPQIKLNDSIAQIASKVKPEIIFTPTNHDLNQDHAIVYFSSLVVTRPPTSVKKIYAYEVASSTETNPVSAFLPNSFLNIDNRLARKIKAFGFYNTEQRPPPNARNKEGITTFASYRGLQCGCKYAEAYQLIKAYEI